MTFRAADMQRSFSRAVFDLEAAEKHVWAVDITRRALRVVEAFGSFAGPTVKYPTDGIIDPTMWMTHTNSASKPEQFLTCALRVVGAAAGLRDERAEAVFFGEVLEDSLYVDEVVVTHGDEDE